MEFNDNLSFRNNSCFKFLVLFSFTILMCRCTEKTPILTLTESEFSFNEKLSSITKDDINPNIFYIGTEDGVIYRYNSDNNRIDTLNTPYDRIYKVYHSKDTETYWIGTRNQGLVRCELIGDSLFVENKAYTIPARNKARKYSTYDILELENEIFAATSHGLFVIKNVNDSAMQLLYPIISKSKQETLLPIVTSNIKLYNKNILYCVSDSGLLQINRGKEIFVSRIFRKPVKNLDITNKEIRFITGYHLYISDKEGKKLKSQSLEHPANFLFYNKSEGIHYLIGNSDVLLVKDIDLLNLSEYKYVPLKYNVRASTCHNIIADDPIHHQSLLVSEHSIVRIGHHQNVFNHVGKIDHISTDDKYVYYLAGTRLYRQEIKGKDSLKAEHLCNLKNQSSVMSFMDVHHGYVYYVTADKKHIFKKQLKSNPFLNLFSPESSLTNVLDKEVTAIGKDEQNVYVGVRDGFQNVNKKEALNLYTNPYNQDTSNICQAPFVTTIYPTKKKTLIGTLNDGLFEGEDGIFYRLKDYKETFIRDVAVDNRDLYVLTNRKISKYNTTTDSVVSYEAQGYCKLLIGSHLYGVKEHGIHDFNTGIDFFTDVQFNPQACAVITDKIYAGSCNGVYVFNELKLDENGKETGYEIVEFSPEYELISFSTTVLLCILALLSLMVVYLYYRHYHIRKTIPVLINEGQEKAKEREKKESLEHIKSRLQARLQEQLKYKEFFDKEMSEEIYEINSKIQELGSDGVEKTQEDANKLNTAIQQLSFRVPTILNIKLEEQGKEIMNLTHGKRGTWINETENTRKGSDISEKAKQIESNKKIIEEEREAEQKLANYTSLYKGVIEIPNVTNEIIKNLQGSNDTPKKKLEIVEKEIEKIKTAEVKGEFLRYITGKEKKIEEYKEKVDETSLYRDLLDQIEGEFQEIMESINEYEENYLNLFKKLSVVNNHYSTIEKLFIVLEIITGNNHKGQQRKDVENVLNTIKDFYNTVRNGSDNCLLELLGIKTKKTKKSDGQFLDAKVLFILLVDKNISNEKIAYYLGANIQRVRSNKKDLKDRIKNLQEELEAHARSHSISIAKLLLEIG